MNFDTSHLSAFAANAAQIKFEVPRGAKNARDCQSNGYPQPPSGLRNDSRSGSSSGLTIANNAIAFEFSVGLIPTSGRKLIGLRRCNCVHACRAFLPGSM